MRSKVRFTFFFFNDTATTEIYTLSLHDALPICLLIQTRGAGYPVKRLQSIHLKRHSTSVIWLPLLDPRAKLDRKSTRLNSSHGYISYAVFCLKKKKK